MIPILAALGAALAAITALHLRSRPRGSAAPYPSFQHLEGLAPKRRPAWPLEDPFRWALRVLALALVALALVLSRRDATRPLAVLVEPGAADWNAAKALAEGSPGIAVAMTFDGERPEVVGSPRSLESIERTRRVLSACSAAYMACLVRAAQEMDGDALVVSRFAERRDTFDGLRNLRLVRTEAVAKAVTPPVFESGTSRVELLGKSPAARLWAAALEVASEGLGGGRGDVAVVDSPEDATSRTGFVLVPITSAGTLARAGPAGSVRLSEDAALAAGTPALDLASNLTLEGSLEPLVAPVLGRRGQTLFVAATDEDLGRWAHGPALVALARVVLFTAGRVAVSGEPDGIADVAPGTYRREDGRVEARVNREPAPDVPALSDRELSFGTLLGNVPEPASASRVPFTLLVIALLLRVLDVPREGWRALVPFALVVGLVSLLALDGTFTRHVDVRRAVLANAGLPGEVPNDDCVKPGAARPCVLTARVGTGEPGSARSALRTRSANAFVLEGPRVDVLSWELPSEVRAGEAGELRVLLDVRRAAGRDVTLLARPTSGPTSEATRRISQDREVVSIALPVRAVTEGISFVLVKASVGTANDAVVVPLVTRTHEARRLVLAGAPSWDARAAGEALAKRGAVERITRVGATAVLSRGGATVDPLTRIDGDLSNVDLIVLTGFTSTELAGARETRLRTYVEAGGALLFLGELPRLSSLPLPVTSPSAEETLLPSSRAAEIGNRRVSFLGFAANPSSLPTAGLVLGRLDAARWIVGRTVGEGRIAAVVAPDPWRLGTEYAAVLGHVAAWLEAGRATGAIVGLTVDPVDPLTLLPEGRARARVLAQRARIRFLEVDSTSELSDLLSRYPVPGPLPRVVAARAENIVWWALAALLVLEVALRRRTLSSVTFVPR